MLNRLSIAIKIFGLAVLLLCLTVVLAGFLLWHVSRLQDEMAAIAQREAPLAAALSKLDEYGLRRRLAFERWFGALNAPRPNQEVLTEAQTNYDAFTERLNHEFVKAMQLLDSPVLTQRGIGLKADYKTASFRSQGISWSWGCCAGAARRTMSRCWSPVVAIMSHLLYGQPSRVTGLFCTHN